MDDAIHKFAELFAQLGLPNDKASIGAFIARHAPLAPEIELHQAPFWTEAQAAMLRKAKAEDANWAELADQLDASLRATPA